MKSTIKIELTTYYEDGANIASYSYTLVTHAVSYLASASWRLRAFKLTLPTAITTITAAARFVSGGAPPAAAARSITVSPAGVIAFLDVKEALLSMSLTLTAADVEEHPYLLMSAMSPFVDGVASATISAVDCLDTFIPITYIASANTIVTVVTISAAYIAAKKIPLMSTVIAQTDLVTREYSGMYAELAAKVIVTLSQLASKAYEGIAAQAVNYLQSGNSPMAMELSLTIHEAKTGVAV